MEWFKSLFKKEKEMVYHYTPTGRLCPFPNMTDDDLDDFEQWEEKEFGIKPLNPNPPIGHVRKDVF